MSGAEACVMTEVFRQGSIKCRARRPTCNDGGLPSSVARQCGAVSALALQAGLAVAAETDEQEDIDDQDNGDIIHELGRKDGPDHEMAALYCDEECCHGQGDAIDQLQHNPGRSCGLPLNHCCTRPNKRRVTSPALLLRLRLLLLLILCLVERRP